MDTQFMPEANHLERLQVLQDTAEGVRKDDFYAELTQEQLDQKNEQFAINASQLNKIELEKKDAVDGFKARMKPLEIVYNSLLEEITIGKEKRHGNLYDIMDTDNSMMWTYDETGLLVGSRCLRPEEKKGQSKLFIPGGGLNKAVNQ